MYVKTLVKFYVLSECRPQNEDAYYSDEDQSKTKKYSNPHSPPKKFKCMTKIN